MQLPEFGTQVGKLRTLWLTLMGMTGLGQGEAPHSPGTHPGSEVRGLGLGCKRSGCKAGAARSAGTGPPAAIAVHERHRLVWLVTFSSRSRLKENLADKQVCAQENTLEAVLGIKGSICPLRSVC